MRIFEFVRNEAGDGDGGGGSATLMSAPAPESPDLAGDTRQEVIQSAAPTGAPSILDEAGALKPGFVDALGADYEPDKGILSRYEGKAIPDVLKSLAENTRTARSKALSYPGEDADEGAWNAWRKGANVPEAVEQIMPHDMEAFSEKTGWSPELLTPAIENAIKRGAPGPVISGMLADIETLAEAQNAAFSQQTAEAQEAAKLELADVFKGEADQRIANAVAAMERVAEKAGLSDDELQALKESPAFGDNPAVIRMFDRIASMVTEAGYRGASGATSIANEFRTPMQRAEAVMNGEDAEAHKLFMAGDPRVNAQVDAWLKEASEAA